MLNKKLVSYPDVVLNAFNTIQSWRSAALVVGFLFVIQTGALVYLAVHQTIILQPQHSTLKGPAKITLGDPFSPAYLTDIARGDAYSLLNWTPENIDTQYAAFLARLTPAMYNVQKETLLAEAELHRDDGLTQSFYVTRTTVKGSTVTHHGVLVRAAGGREVFRGPAAYEFSYENAGNGMLQISGVAQPAGRGDAKPSSRAR